MQGILHIVHTLWTCARISFNFLRKTYTFCMEGLYILHGTAAHILWKNYTFSAETLPIFYRTVIHFVRKSCIFSTENPVHIRFYGSVMHLLRNSYTFSKEVLHIFYGTRVSLTGHRKDGTDGVVSMASTTTSNPLPALYCYDISGSNDRGG